MPATNFPYGINNVAENDPLGQLPVPSPGVAHTYFNDFDTFTATDWTVVETQAGATQAVASGDGGLLVLTNTGTISDINGIIQANTGFILSATTNWWAAARLKITQATNGAILFGFMDVLTGFNPANGVYLTKAAAGTVWTLRAEKASAVTLASGSSAALANDTFCEVGISFNAAEQRIRGWVNGAAFASISTLTNIPIVATGLGVAVQSGTGAVSTLTVDWMLGSKQRTYPAA